MAFCSYGFLCRAKDEEPVRGDPLHPFDPAGRPVHDDGIDRGVGPEAELHPWVTRGEIAAVSPYAAPQRGLTGPLEPN